MRHAMVGAMAAVFLAPRAEAQPAPELGVGVHFHRSGDDGAGGALLQIGLRLPVVDRLAARMSVVYAFSPTFHSGDCASTVGIVCPTGGHRHLLGLDAVALVGSSLQSRSGFYGLAGGSVIDGGGNNRFQTERTVVPNVGGGLWSGAHAVELSYRYRGSWNGAAFHFVALTYLWRP